MSVARAIVSPEVLPLYDGGLKRTQSALRAVTHELETWVKHQQTVPRGQDGQVPYLNGKLDYSDPAEIAFAARLREQGVILLRQKEGM